MKNTIKIVIAFVSCIVLFSCTNDKVNNASANGFQLRKDASIISPLVLTEAIKTDLFTKLNWDRSNNGVSSAATYTIVVSNHDAPQDDSNLVESSTGINPDTDSRSATLTVENFNTLINQLPSFSCNPMNIDIRIKSKLGNSSNALYQYSNPITVNVTGYAKTPLVIAFVKDADLPANSGLIKSSSFDMNTDYQGFFYLEAGNYKFYRPDGCGSFASPAIYGISGGNSGTVIQDGITSYNVSAAGHYFVTANLTTGAYTITPFNNTASLTNLFGIFGNATKLIGYSNTTPMTYNPVAHKWSLTINLINGKKISFKTGNGVSTAAVLVGSGTASTTTTNPLTVSAGVVDITGTIKVPGDYVNDATKTKYDIVVDVSNPRNYTFTMMVNPN